MTNRKFTQTHSSTSYDPAMYIPSISC